MAFTCCLPCLQKADGRLDELIVAKVRLEEQLSQEKKEREDLERSAK